MKNIELVAFTPGGAELGEILREKLRGEGHNCRLQVSKSVAEAKAEAEGVNLPAFDTLRSWTERAFETADALIIIGACGIAIRAIAPFVRDKFTDPAVLAVDEMGRFVQPLLSGHFGGANALAIEIAGFIGAQAVISTGTDVRGKFAVDVWAREQCLFIDGRDAAKRISAALLAGKSVAFESDFPVEGNLPGGVMRGGGELGFCVTLNENKRPFKYTLRLHPKIVTLGIGCRRGVGADIIENAVTSALAGANISCEAVRAVNSIDLKANEVGLIEFCRRWDVEFNTFSSERLRAQEGSFTRSEFVESTVGVDNVCERAAVASGGELILRKRGCDGVTVAVAALPYTVGF